MGSSPPRICVTAGLVNEGDHHSLGIRIARGMVICCWALSPTMGSWADCMQARLDPPGLIPRARNERGDLGLFGEIRVTGAA